VFAVEEDLKRVMELSFLSELMLCARRGQVQEIKSNIIVAKLKITLVKVIVRSNLDHTKSLHPQASV
jgi:hypothetical protein